VRANTLLSKSQSRIFQYSNQIKDVALWREMFQMEKFANSLALRFIYAYILQRTWIAKKALEEFTSSRTMIHLI